MNPPTFRSGAAISEESKSDPPYLEEETHTSPENRMIWITISHSRAH